MHFRHINAQHKSGGGGPILEFCKKVYQIVANMQLFGCEAKWASPPITLKHVLNIAGSFCGLPIQPACVADRMRAPATSSAILAERPSAELPKGEVSWPSGKARELSWSGRLFQKASKCRKTWNLVLSLFCAAGGDAIYHFRLPGPEVHIFHNLLNQTELP